MLGLFLSLLVSPVFAQPEKLVATTPEECHAVDLRNEFLGPNRDQGDVAWCYAFSSTDLLAYRFQETERLSAADVAIGHNNGVLPTLIKRIQNIFVRKKDPETWAMPYQTGFSKIALQRALQTGTCPEHIFPSEKWVKRGPAGERDIVPLKTAMLDIAELKRQTDRGLPLEELPYWYELAGLSKEDFFAIVKRTHRLDIFPRLRRTVCEPHRREYAKNPGVSMILRLGNIFRTVDRELSADNPVLLDYDSRVLKDHQHQGISINHLHTSLIVGRRWHNDRCEYLIRDSYGTDCEDYDATYKCESGNVWIPQHVLYRNMTSVVYLHRL